jgi:hypothetical protein
VYRRRAIVDRPLAAVLGNQQRMICQPDNRSLRQDPVDGAFNRLPGVLVDDLKDAAQWEPGCLGTAPTGESLGNRI